MYATVGSGSIKAKGFVDPQLQVAFCLTVLNPSMIALCKHDLVGSPWSSNVYIVCLPFAKVSFGILDAFSHDSSPLKLALRWEEVLSLVNAEEKSWNVSPPHAASFGGWCSSHFLIPFATTDDYNSGPFATSESTRAEKGMSIRCPSKIREL